MKSLEKLDKYIVSYYRFGVAVGVLYKGDDHYKTRLGALFSIAVYVLVIINLVNFITAFLDGSRLNESAQTLKCDTFDSELYNLYDMSFEIEVLI